MKFILLSDGHITCDKPIGRLDSDMLQIGIDKLGYIFQHACDNNIPHILQAGDFVDVKRSWELLSSLSKFLDSWKKKGIFLSCCLGQHDMYFHDVSNEKTIMGVLISTGLIKRLSSMPYYFGDHSDIAIYGSSFGENIPEPYDISFNILVCHRQILMSKIFKQQEKYDYAPAFLKEYNYDLILCGDAHQKFDFKLGKRIVCNTGPLMRLEATDDMMNHQPCFYVFDTETRKLSTHLIPAKLGSEVLSKDHIAIQKLRKQNFDDFIGKVQEIGGQNQSLDFNQNLQAIMKQSKASENVKYKISEYLAKGE
jgi:predicted phosphodiesterase